MMHSDSIPRFTLDEAARLARIHYGLVGRLTALPSYSDQNFLLRTDAGSRVVLRIARASTVPQGSVDPLMAQLEALLYLAGDQGRQEGKSRRVPRLQRTRTGGSYASCKDRAGRLFLVHLLEYLEGRPLVELRPLTPELLRGTGRLVAEVDQGLAGFTHPAARRDLVWDLRQAPGLLPATDHIEPAQKRRLAKRYLAEFSERVTPRQAELPWGVIHNDGNDHNVLVSRDAEGASEVTGLIDFGDLVYTCRVFGLAIACAYAMLGESDPLGVAGTVVAGYQDVEPLCGPEVEVLFPAMLARLAVSVTLSARERRRRPEETYLAVSEQDAWTVMDRLSGVAPEEARERLINI